jgi:hypothetical protein
MIKGVDVSNYQAASGWESGIDFVFIKLTEGTSYVNPKWVQQRQTGRDAGLVIGFYHFVRPGNMISQADHMLSQVALSPGDVLCLDWEDTGVSSAEKDAWISYVQGRTGHRVVLYCNGYFWKSLDRSSFAGDGLWIATAGYPAGSPNITSAWLLHQYSTAGGIDHDVAQFDSRASMLAWAGGIDDVALTPADKTWFSAEVNKIVDAKIKALVYSQVWDQDRMPAPDTAPDKLTNANQLPRNVLRGAYDLASAAEQAARDTLAQAAMNGSSLTEIKATLAAIDLSQLPAEIAAKLETLKLNITVTEGP